MMDQPPYIVFWTQNPKSSKGYKSHNGIPEVNSHSTVKRLEKVNQ